MSNPSIRSRAGWSDAENERLFLMAAEAAKDSRPLKSVFDNFAAASGRRPNSVRNYYYARVKLGDAAFSHTPAFVPFTDAESESLLKSVLSAQAGGESVRSCTLRLGGGDDRAMLRYQNKYRSLVRTNPNLVRRVLSALKAQGLPCVDPYLPRTGAKRVGRPKKSRSLADAASAVLQDLGRVEGLDVSAFFESLGTLAIAAVSGLRKNQHPDAPAAEEIAHLKSQLSDSEDRYRTLLSYFRQLIRVNTEFLKMNSAVRVSDLTGYIRDLALNVETCQAFVKESASS